jgi:hypothetical protein
MYYTEKSDGDLDWIVGLSADCLSDLAGLEIGRKRLELLTM